MISTVDDYFHELTDDPRWSESAWFGFTIPERTITGFVYMYHRRNQKHTMAGVGLFDLSGENMWDCLFHDWFDTMPLAPDANMFDFQADNGLTVRCVAPLKTFELSYNGEGLELDLTFNAVMEPFDSGLPGKMQDWAIGGAETGHYEQGGRITGTIKVETLPGETLTVDSWSVRDHSWGPRHITAKTPRGVNPWAASENCSFFLSAVGRLPSEDDPVDDTTEEIVEGYHHADGKSGGLFEGTYTCVERGEDGRPLTVVMEAKDTLGRDFRAEGRCVSWLIWPGYPHYFQWWSLAEFDVNGEKAWGNVMEWLPSDLARRWLRTKKGAAPALPAVERSG